MAKAERKAAAPADMTDPASWTKEMRAIARPLSSVQRYPRNTRTHPPAQIELLANLLRKFGPDQPIVVDERDVILKGHGRWEAARAAAMTHFPVVRRPGLSEEDKTALRIADNQVALLSGWDATLMQVEIGQLKAAGYELSLLGFGDAQLVEFTTTPGPPGQFPAFGEDIDVAHQCPKCGYVGSGSWAPKEPEPPRPAGKKKKTVATLAPYYFSKNVNGYVTGKRFSVDEPCVTVMGRRDGGGFDF